MRCAVWSQAGRAHLTWPLTSRRSSTRSPTTSTPRRRSRRCSSGCGRPIGVARGGRRRPARDAGVLGLEDLTPLEAVGDMAAIDPEAMELLARREAARAGARFRGGRPSARGARATLRDGRSATELPAGSASADRQASPSRDPLRPQPRQGGAARAPQARGRRGVGDGGRGARAVARGRAGQERFRRGGAAALRLDRASGDLRGGGRVSILPRPRSCSRARTPWWWRSTRCRTRRTWGRSAVPRSAPAPPAW